MHKTRSRGLAAILALALVTAACGNEESTSDSGDDPPETDSATTAVEADPAAEEHPGGATDVGVTADTIRVSMIVSQTGNSAAGQVGFEKGFEAYVEALNDAGGVHGRTIEIVNTHDDGGDPARNKQVFEQAVNGDDIFLVVGSWPSFGAAEFASTNQIPIVGAAYDRVFHSDDAFFGVTGGSWDYPDPANLPQPPGATAAIDAYILGKQGGDKFGSLAYNHPASAGGAESACDNVELFDMECTYEDTSLDFGFTDLGASIQAIKDSGATHFYAAMDIAGCATILRSWLRAGLDDLTLRCAIGYGQETIDNFPDLVDNLFVLLTTAPFESDVPEMQRFLTEMETRKPGETPGSNALVGWMSGVFLEDALEELGPNVTRERFIEAGRNAEVFSNWTARGLTNAIDWTTNRHLAAEKPDFAPDPDLCAGALVRPDLEAGSWTQVGQEPLMCLAGVRDGADLQSVLAEDGASLEP